MPRIVGYLVVNLAVVGLVALGTAGPALAAQSTRGGGSTHRGGGSNSTTGNDLSYPQCGTTFPAAPEFGIVAVNGGLANDLNPCLGPSAAYPSYTQSELYWAVTASTGITSQPKASLYLNTADPGNLYNGTPIADWPTSSSAADPYGACTTVTVTTSGGTYTVGANSTACAWQYGYNMAGQDVAWLAGAAGALDSQQAIVNVPGSAAGYPWWLDVETANTWQSGISGQAMNVADLQGMSAALTFAGAAVIGAYSTASQWSAITGGTTASSGSLYGIPDWIPGARTLAGATMNCGLPSFTGGTVTVTQWAGRPDKDHAC